MPPENASMSRTQDFDYLQNDDSLAEEHYIIGIGASAGGAGSIENIL